MSVYPRERERKNSGVDERRFRLAPIPSRLKLRPRLQDYQSPCLPSQEECSSEVLVHLFFLEVGKHLHYSPKTHQTTACMTFIHFIILAICSKCRKTLQSSVHESNLPEIDFEDITEHLSALNLVSVFSFDLNVSRHQTKLYISRLSLTRPQSSLLSPIKY